MGRKSDYERQKEKWKKEEIKRKAKKVLKENEELVKEMKEEGYEIRMQIVKRTESNDIEREECLKEFLEEQTQKTQNMKHVISLGRLLEEYLEWFDMDKYTQEHYIDTEIEFGKTMKRLGKGSEMIRQGGKTFRGWRNIKLKDENEPNISEFIEKHMEETGNTEDRVKLTIFVWKYGEWAGETNEETGKRNGIKMNKDMIKQSMIKNNILRIKTCFETKEEHEKKKTGNNECYQQPCLMGVRWKEGIEIPELKIGS